MQVAGELTKLHRQFSSISKTRNLEMEQPARFSFSAQTAVGYQVESSPPITSEA